MNLSKHCKVWCFVLGFFFCDSYFLLCCKCARWCPHPQSVISPACHWVWISCFHSPLHSSLSCCFHKTCASVLLEHWRRKKGSSEEPGCLAPKQRGRGCETLVETGMCWCGCWLRSDSCRWPAALVELGCAGCEESCSLLCVLVLARLASVSGAPEGPGWWISWRYWLGSCWCGTTKVRPFHISCLQAVKAWRVSD